MNKLFTKLVIVAVVIIALLFFGFAYFNSYSKKPINTNQNNFIQELDPKLSAADRKVFEDQLAKTKATLADTKDDAVKYGLYMQLGFVDYGLGHLQESVNDFNQAIKISPEEYGVYVSLSQTQIDMNDNQGAMDSLQKALAINSGNADAWHWLIQLKIDRFNVSQDEVRGLFTQAMDATKALPTYVDILTFYAPWLEKIGDLPGAKNYWGQAILANPTKRAVYQGEIDRLGKN